MDSANIMIDIINILLCAMYNRKIHALSPECVQMGLLMPHSSIFSIQMFSLHQILTWKCQMEFTGLLTINFDSVGKTYIVSLLLILSGVLCSHRS